MSAESESAPIEAAREVPSPRRKWRLRALALLLVVLLCEGTLRLATAVVPKVGRVLERPPELIVKDERLEWRPNPELDDHDARGWRNPAALERASIVAIGDSQTYGTSVARDEAWPLQLGALTGLATYNISCGGYGPAHYFELTDDALALEPELLVVGFYAGNDLADSYRFVCDEQKVPALLTGPRPDAPPLVPSVEGIWRETQVAATNQPFNPPARTTVTFLTDHSKVLALLRGAYRALKPKADPKAAEWEAVRRRAEGDDPDLVFAHDDEVAATLLTPALRLAVMDLDDVRVAEGLNVSLEALRQIRDRAAPETRVLVLLIPTKEYVLHDRVKDGPPALARMVEHEQELWRRTKAFLEQHGIASVDGLDALRAAVARGESPYFSDHDGHPNAVGQRALAAAVAGDEAVQRLLRDEALASAPTR